MKKQKGFTLIELMIVVAIIGVLASIALPAYQTYTKKAHVLEGLNLASSAKTAIWDYWSSNGSYPANNGAAGLAATITGHAVKSVLVTNNAITITYNNRVIDDATVIITSSNTSGALNWDCTTGTLANKYRPTTCR